MTAIFQEAQHPRGPHGEWVKKAFAGVKGKTPPKSFKFYKQGYKPKSTGPNAHHYGKTLYEAKKAGHFSSDYEFWLAAQKLHAHAKKKHPTNAPSPHGIVNAAFNHEISDTGSLNMLGTSGGVQPKVKNVHDVTSTGVKTVSKFLAPGQLQSTGKKMPGVNGAMVYQDNKGQLWLVKFPGGSKGTSQAYSNSAFLVDLDVATSRIQNKAGLPVPSIHAKTVDGKVASVHKMYSRAQQAFPSNAPKLQHLNEQNVIDIQKNMVLDWLLSNHDPHSGNFLKTDKGIIGIDKGQSFKYFGKDNLTPQFGSDINPPLAPNVPVYSTLMKQHMAGQGHLASFNSGEVHKTIQRLMAIPDDEYKDMLRPYAEKAASVGLLSYPGKNSTHASAHNLQVKLFLDAAVARKNNLATDFAKLDAELNKKPATLEELSPEGMKSSWEADFAGVAKKYTPEEAYQKGIITGEEYDKYKGQAKGKVKVPGELAKDMSVVKMGDWVSFKGGTPVEVVGVSPHAISLASGSLVGATDFDMGHVEWAAPPKPKGATGYSVVAHPTETGKFTIKKPNGEFSKSSGGEVKSWATEELAAGSSTMAKYKTQQDQQAKAGMAGAQAFAINAPDIPDPNNSTASGMKLAVNLSLDEAIEYTNIKAKIAAGQAYTPDEYLKLKSAIAKIKNAGKAAGAAQVEHDFEGGGFTPPAKVATKPGKSGFKETPKFKQSGGQPPELSKATGPNALEDGAKLWAMKKAGKITDDYKMWSQAKSASGKYKKAALLKNPNAQAGVDYSSANQIRNVAMRLEYDETGDVSWTTSEQMTSQSEGQTVKEMKHTLGLHEHKPVVKASAVHHHPLQAVVFGGGQFDKSAPVGSYQNPHSFKNGDTQALQAYGYKYTDHSNWNDEQHSAWYKFTGSGSGNVNQYFRTGDVGIYGNVASTKQQAKALVDAFKSPNVKPLDDWTIVTRGTSGGWELGIGSDSVTFDQMKAMEGKVVRNKCPVSSSLRDSPAFGGALRITYKLPPGFRGIAALGKSSHSSENEMILPPGMAYRILEVKQSGGSGYNEVLVEVVDVKLPEIT